MILCRSPTVAGETLSISERRKRQAKFRAINENGYFFQKPGRATIDNMTFLSPGSTTKQFYLIRQYNGRDGKVWLSINTAGRLVMVKFRKFENKSDVKFSSTFYDADNDAEEDDKKDDIGVDRAAQLLQNVELEDTSSQRPSPVKAESDAWKKAYDHLGVNTFVTKLASKEALVMPFSFCYQINGELPLYLSFYLSCNDTFGESLGGWASTHRLLELSINIGAVENMFTAIKTLAFKSLRHNDINL